MFSTKECWAVLGQLGHESISLAVSVDRSGIAVRVTLMYGWHAIASPNAMGYRLAARWGGPWQC